MSKYINTERILCPVSFLFNLKYSSIFAKTNAIDVDKKRKSTTINKTSNEVISISKSLTLGVGCFFDDPVHRARQTAMVAHGFHTVHEA